MSRTVILILKGMTGALATQLSSLKYQHKANILETRIQAIIRDAYGVLHLAINYINWL
jgi:hypothetical protein